MADFKLQSGNVLLDVNAGLGGVHKITTTYIPTGNLFILTQQQLMTIVAPALESYMKALINANTPTSPAPNTSNS